MANKRILVYIEGEGGGGTTSKRKYLDSEFRKAWKQFLQPLADLATQKGVMRFQCIPGRGGARTIDRFTNPLLGQAGALRILLIDSESPVGDVTKPWKALGMACPAGADDKSCYLMVQCLETWLLADVDNLRDYFNKRKKCFRDNKVKAWPNLESVPRKTIQDAIEQATAGCSSPYTHADGNLLIAIVDRDKLKKLSAVARLFTDFGIKIGEYASE